MLRLTRLRRFARPLGVFAIVAFLAPGAVVDCREMSALAGEAMACCNPSSDAGLKTDCCAVADEAQPERPASTSAPARAADPDTLAVSAATLPSAGPTPTRVAGTIDPLDTGPPPDRLYILYAVIRR